MWKMYVSCIVRSADHLNKYRGLEKSDRSQRECLGLGTE